MQTITGEVALNGTKKDTPPQWEEERGELELTRNDDRVAYTLLEALEEKNPKMI
jgi:hypothetical protein